MTTSIAFDPSAPWSAIAAIAAAILASIGFGFWRGARGAWLRLAAGAALIALLANPMIREADRTPLDDIALIVTDESASQSLDGRLDAARAAVDQVRARLTSMDGVEIVEARVAGADETRLVAAIEQALADSPRARLAALFVITDGQAIDAADAALLEIDAPAHLLLTGRANEFDRKLTLLNAPRYGILKEPALIRFRIDDLGRDGAPRAGGDALVSLSVDGEVVARQRAPVGRDIEFSAPIDRPGGLVLELSVEPVEGELTTRNNAAVIDITAIRDRLRVLLISGAPHPGERVWRNILKSDPSVDLVHFTILRPIEKARANEFPNELSLIEFPVDELFFEKISAFDLVIFDRYDFNGVLRPDHFANIADYVADGGAVLVAAGPEFSTVRRLDRPGNFGAILPAEPLARAEESPFRPALTQAGARHPATADLPQSEYWGRWLRVAPARARSGQTLMTGAGGAPLLVLDRVEQGRVGLLLSDHVWLWARGFDGGGPHAELLRRLAHWLMKEPELEEERLSVLAAGADLVIQRTTLKESPGGVEIEGPDGRRETLSLTPVDDEPGAFSARRSNVAPGLYKARADGLFAVGAVGVAAPEEFQNVISTQTLLKPLADRTGGGVFSVRRTNGLETPALRRVDARAGAKSGAGWAGVALNRATRTDSVRDAPLGAPGLWLALVATFLLGAWAQESGYFKRSKT
jgi:uncharacterized membrane protein